MTEKSTRGISEVVSFILVFSLVVSIVGVVYVSGFSGLNRVQDTERLSNAERAFDVLNDNIEDIYREEAPSRATEIKLSGADIGIGNSSTLDISITNSSGVTSTYSKTIDPIVYSAPGSDTEIVYEGGAVIRTDGSNGIMKDNPPFLFTKNGANRRAVIPIIQTRSVGATRVGGSATVLVRTENSVRRVLATDRDSTETYDVVLTFQTTPARAPIWESYFDDQILWVDDPCSVSVSGVKVTCTFTADEVYVTWSGINVDIQT